MVAFPSAALFGPLESRPSKSVNRPADSIRYREQPLRPTHQNAQQLRHLWPCHGVLPTGLPRGTNNYSDQESIKYRPPLTPLRIIPLSLAAGLVSTFYAAVAYGSSQAMDLLVDSSGEVTLAGSTSWAPWRRLRVLLGGPLPFASDEWPWRLVPYPVLPANPDSSRHINKCTGAQMH